MVEKMYMVFLRFENDKNKFRIVMIKWAMS